jgi:eukaryotic-like serine/threonine-protein kinase
MLEGRVRSPIQTIGRYAVFDEIAKGGMATVHLGRLVGAAGFARTVAIKRLHPHYAKDPHFVAGFIDEARLAARIRHPNVVATLDVEAGDDHLILVMEYVLGESLSRLVRTSSEEGSPVPPKIAAAIMSGVLLGLHAAHEAKDERGAPLGIVHRDVSPQNILVGSDGVARVLDFGIAKALGRLQTTQAGHVKGKLRYMAPEQVLMSEVTPRTDIYAAAVVLWEILTGRRLIRGDSSEQLMASILEQRFDAPRTIDPRLPTELDRIVMRGLDRNPRMRFESARAFALDLERSVGLATPTQVEAWMHTIAKSTLEARASALAAMEMSASSDPREIRGRVEELAAKMVGGSVDVTRAESRGRVSTFEDGTTARMSRETREGEGTETAPIPTMRPPGRSARSRAPLAVAIAAVAALAIAGVAYRLMTDSSPRPTETPLPEAEPAGSGSIEGPKGSTSSSVTRARAAVASPRAPAKSTPAPVKSAPAPKRARPKPTVRTGCDPAYWIDADGIRRPKPECL